MNFSRTDLWNKFWINRNPKKRSKFLNEFNYV